MRPLLLALIAFAPSMLACGVSASLFGDETPSPTPNAPCQPGSGSYTAPPEEAEPRGIRRFDSEDELDGYMKAIEAANAAEQSKMQAAYAACNKGGGTMDASAGASPSSAEASGAASNDAITNNQEAGVDEGGIVKNIGNALVVLRQGRLYVVDVTEGAPPSLSDSMRVARSQSINQSVWYDEMLVKGDLVYVVGYRYGVAAPGEAVRGATEIDTFRLTGGKLTRLRSMFLESNDYYSGRNYASRMLDGKLVFYMPHYISRVSGKLAYPRVLELDDGGTFSVEGPIFGALDVFTSLTKPSYAAFHTVVECALPDTGALECHGRSVLGNAWREHYVATDATYLWAGTSVYRFDFRSLDVTAHRSYGYPVDQFSFKKGESDLFVAVNAPEDPRQQQKGPYSGALLQLPISAFDKIGGQAVVPAKPLGTQVNLVSNRFVGDVLVAAITSPSKGSPDIVSLDTKSGAFSHASSSNVVRLEPLGADRVLVVTGMIGKPGLSLEAFRVHDMTQSLGRVDLQGISQGEGRSHGFFFKPGENGAGVFGYAVVNPPQWGASWGWGNGISNIGFFGVGTSGSLSSLGIVSAGQVATECETSCTDWYGNTRPIFLGQRVFSLMGSELAEVSLAPSVSKGAAAALQTSAQ